jgi:hypothetical protein
VWGGKGWAEAGKFSPKYLLSRRRAGEKFKFFASYEVKVQIIKDYFPPPHGSFERVHQG